MQKNRTLPSFLRPNKLRLSVKNNGKNLNHRRFGKKTKSLLAVGIIAIVLISVFIFQPQRNGNSGETGDEPQSNDNPNSSPVSTATKTPKQDSGSGVWTNLGSAITSIFTPQKPPGIIASADQMTTAVWKDVANCAWQYFNTMNGLNEKTGLPLAATDYAYFTDWDLGIYIQAVLDAKNLGLIGENGTWGSNNRLDKVLSFLETRNLTSNRLPYQWYESATGDPNPKLSVDNANVADTGNLLVALKNCWLACPNFRNRIDYIVMNRTDYASMVPIVAGLAGSNNIYDYYVASGFAGFWPSLSNVPPKILSNILAGSSTVVNKNKGNITLPESKLSCEPMMLAIFNLPQTDTRLLDLTQQVYLAHEEYYNLTETYRAFSEGNTIQAIYAYEWVILPDGRTWTILDESGGNFSITPIIYTKAAMGFLALYNTTYAKNMCAYLETNLDTTRYLDGIDESQRQISSFGCNTNGLVLSAARYAIRK